jgi:hypothetical protein
VSTGFHGRCCRFLSNRPARARAAGNAARKRLIRKNLAGADGRTPCFGLGLAPRGTAEVLWPGGVRNRLYDVAAGESLRVPEIPCSFAAAWPDADAYATCVGDALDAWVSAGAVDAALAARLLASALRAFQEG